MARPVRDLPAGLGRPQEDHLRFSMTQVGLLDALLESEEFVEVDARFAKRSARSSILQGVKQAARAGRLSRSLRPYQQEGLGWLQFLQDFHFGGCLADDIGSREDGPAPGSAAGAEEPEHIRRPSIIVVPMSPMFNWVHEIERFTPALKHVEYTGLRARICGMT